MCYFVAGGVQRRPPLPQIENVLDVEHPGQPLQENGRTTTPVNDESDRGDEVERYVYVSAINRPSMSESVLSNPTFFAQSDIHITPAQSQIINDTGKEANDFLFSILYCFNLTRRPITKRCCSRNRELT